VVDRQAGPGRETSFANGGLLTPSMAEPWNAPGCWRVLLASLARSDSALQLRLRALPSLLNWGVSFLRNSRLAAFERSALANLRLARYSLRVLDSLRQHTGIAYGQAARGSLRIFRNPIKLDEACAVAIARASEGLTFRRLSAVETIELEPALTPIADQLAGALHYHADEIGDAYQFCLALADYVRQMGVAFHFEAPVSSLEVSADQLVGARTERKRFVADKYVIAAGSYSTPLLRRAGVHLPVQPVKGYSMTIDGLRNRHPLRIPVVDDELHAVVVPLESAVRVAGTAEFAGYDRTIPVKRIRNLEKLLREVLPQAQFDPASVSRWCGLRPMAADGVPIIGGTPISNLFVNTGHGHLGWTTAAGSAQLLSDLMCGVAPAIDSTSVALERFTVS
jgi:D-amino-acid dehydrogenase